MLPMLLLTAALAVPPPDVGKATTTTVRVGESLAATSAIATLPVMWMTMDRCLFQIGEDRRRDRECGVLQAATVTSLLMLPTGLGLMTGGSVRYLDVAQAYGPTPSVMPGLTTVSVCGGLALLGVVTGLATKEDSLFAQVVTPVGLLAATVGAIVLDVQRGGVRRASRQSRGLRPVIRIGGAF